MVAQCLLYYFLSCDKHSTKKNSGMNQKIRVFCTIPNHDQNWFWVDQREKNSDLSTLSLFTMRESGNATTSSFWEAPLCVHSLFFFLLNWYPVKTTFVLVQFFSPKIGFTCSCVRYYLRLICVCFSPVPSRNNKNFLLEKVDIRAIILIAMKLSSVTTDAQ